MKRKEKFEVTAAAFEALLGNNQLWEEYMKHFNRDQLCGQSEEIYTDWKKWARDTPVYHWVSCAFVWSKTPHGRNTWIDFNYAWLLWICMNLNN